MQYVACYVWFLWLSIMFSRFIYVVACISNLFLFMDVYYSVVWIYPILLIYSLAENIWIVSTFLALVNNAVMNICIQVFMWTYEYSEVYIWTELIAGSYGGSMFSIFWTANVFQSSFTILHYHKFMKVPDSPYPHQNLLLSIFLIHVYNHPSSCEVVPHCAFHLCFPND